MTEDRKDFQLKDAPKTMQYFYVAGTIIISVTIILLLYVVYLLLFPVKTIELNRPLTVITPEVKRGGTVTFLLDYCKYVDSESEVNVSFLNSTLIPSVTSVQHFPTGCHKKYIDAIVPLSAPPHEYQVIMRKTLRVNHIRWDPKVFESENKFRVVDSIQIHQSTQSGELLMGVSE